MTRPVQTCALETGPLRLAEYSVLFSTFIISWLLGFQSYDERLGAWRTFGKEARREKTENPTANKKTKFTTETQRSPREARIHFFMSSAYSVSLW